MDAAQIDGPWALAGLISTTLITGIFGLLMLRVKGKSDEDQPAEEALKKIEQREDLRPVVRELVRQMGEVQEELEMSRPIVKVKYPLALNTITAYRHLHPKSEVHIPWQVEEDL